VVQVYNEHHAVAGQVAEALGVQWDVWDEAPCIMRAGMCLCARYIARQLLLLLLLL
jgi:hypothetical protein